MSQSIEQIPTNNVIDLASHRGETGSSQSVDYLTSIRQMREKDNYKEIIDAALMEFYINNMNASVSKDNPFDAVYLCELRPDIFSEKIVAELNQFKNIKDLSSEIYFDDGMDD